MTATPRQAPMLAVEPLLDRAADQRTFDSAMGAREEIEAWGRCEATRASSTVVAVPGGQSATKSKEREWSSSSVGSEPESSVAIESR